MALVTYLRSNRLCKIWLWTFFIVHCDYDKWSLWIHVTWSKILRWRHKESHCVSNHRRLYCLLKRLFKRRSKKTSKLCATGLCEGSPPVTGGYLSPKASNPENDFHFMTSSWIFCTVVSSHGNHKIARYQWNNPGRCSMIMREPFAHFLGCTVSRSVLNCF